MPRVYKYEALYLEKKHLLEAAEAELATLRAAVEERERAIVWAVYHRTIVDGCSLEWVDCRKGAPAQHWTPFDGTDADLIRVVIEQSKGAE